MFTLRRPPSPINAFVLILAALAVILGCRAGDLAAGIRQSRVGVTPVAANPTHPKPSASATLVALVETPTEAATETPTETLEPSPTEAPTDTLEPSDTATPAATRTPAPPTRIPPPTQTFTPAPPPSPTRCPDQFCVIKQDCIPGQDTRAIGHIYSNGVPLNGVRVRVSYDNGGAPAASDFISGHDPINPKDLWPGHDGYYQIGIREGKPFDGNWWVFLVDATGNNVLSEGRWFKTTDVTTGDSCQIGVTDFGS